MEIFALAAYVLVASSTSGAFNQWYERDIDAIMDRTKDRPFVTKELEPKNAWNLWLIIISTLALYATFQVSNFEATLYLFAGIFTYGIVYTVWLKRRTWMNIVIGGLAGSFAVLVGSAATGNTFSPAPLILSVVFFFMDAATLFGHWPLALRMNMPRQISRCCLWYMVTESQAKPFSGTHWHWLRFLCRYFSMG